MRKRMAILITLTLGVTAGFCHDPGMHMLIGSKTFGIWDQIDHWKFRGHNKRLSSCADWGQILTFDISGDRTAETGTAAILGWPPRQT
jgi:hypothetical protein